jgi:hypothetical protein
MVFGVFFYSWQSTLHSRVTLELHQQQLQQQPFSKSFAKVM